MTETSAGPARRSVNRVNFVQTALVKRAAQEPRRPAVAPVWTPTQTSPTVEAAVPPVLVEKHVQTGSALAPLGKPTVAEPVETSPTISPTVAHVPISALQDSFVPAESVKRTVLPDKRRVAVPVLTPSLTSKTAEPVEPLAQVERSVPTEHANVPQGRRTAVELAGTSPMTLTSVALVRLSVLRASFAPVPPAKPVAPPDNRLVAALV